MNKLNVFTGNNSVLKFLSPDYNTPTPLVEIPNDLNPYYSEGVRIYAKLMNFNALHNIKSLPALNMLLTEKEKLKKTHTIIENSSGNTVFSLAIIAKHLGVAHTKAFVSHEVSRGKLQLLRLLGTEPIVNKEPICPDPSDQTSGIYKAKMLGEKPGWFNPGQYENENNPHAHYKWTGPQIWKQTNRKIDILCAGLGTTGTIYGTGKYLKEKNKNIISVGVARQVNNPVPGVRTPHLLKQIAFNWKAIVDQIEEVGTTDSFLSSLALCRAGILVGPSSGFALTGLLKYLGRNKSLRRNKTCVFICCDSPLPYIDEYFEYIDSTHFPQIQNEELLLNKPTKIINTQSIEVDVHTAFKAIYAESMETISDKVNKAQPISPKENCVLLDVRTTEEFEDAHLPCARNIKHTEAIDNIENIADEVKNKSVYVLCKSGARSSLVVSALREKNVTAFNIKGGMIEWSLHQLPRIKPQGCKIAKLNS